MIFVAHKATLCFSILSKMHTFIHFLCLMVSPFLPVQISCSSSTGGYWKECNGVYYYFSAKKYNWDDSLQFCGHLADDTHVADLGRQPVDLAKSCSFGLKDNRQYWIECWYGQAQSDCTTLKKQRQKIERRLTSCNTIAYPICGTRKRPIKALPTDKKSTPALTSKKPTRAQITKGLKTTSTTHVQATTSRNTVQATTKVTHVPTTRTLTRAPSTRKSTRTHTTKPTTQAPITRTKKHVQTTINLSQLFSISTKKQTHTQKPKMSKHVAASKKSMFPPTTKLSKNAPTAKTLNNAVTFRNSKHEQTTNKSKSMSVARNVTHATKKVAIVPITRQSLHTQTTKKPTEAQTEIKTTEEQTAKHTTEAQTAKHTTGEQTAKITTEAQTAKHTSYYQQATWKTKRTTTTMPPTTETDHSWVRINTSEYFVNHIWYNYTSAREYCIRTKNAFLMTSLSPVRYIQILSRLNLRDGKYWIKAHDNALSAQGCLTYDSLKRSLSQSNCTRALYSVCSRSVFGNNVTDILENAVFKQMLKDMTLDRTNTAVSRRHRMSINNDHRWSVRATGVIGLLIIGVVMGLMVLSDLTKLSGCQCYRLCKCCKRISRKSKDKNLKMLNKNLQTSSQC